MNIEKKLTNTTGQSILWVEKLDSKMFNKFDHEATFIHGFKFFLTEKIKLNYAVIGYKKKSVFFLWIIDKKNNAGLFMEGHLKFKNQISNYDFLQKKLGKGFFDNIAYDENKL